MTVKRPPMPTKDRKPGWRGASLAYGGMWSLRSSLPIGTRIIAIRSFGPIPEGSPGIITGTTKVPHRFWRRFYYLCTFPVNRKVAARPEYIGAFDHGRTLKDLEIWVFPEQNAAVDPAKRLVTLDFAAGSPDIQLLKSGWSDPEPWGTWSIGLRSEINLSIKDRNGDVAITLEGAAFLEPFLDRQEVSVEANGILIGQMIFTSNNNELSHQFSVPRTLIAKAQGSVALAFVFTRTFSPADVGQSRDSRKLGIGLRKLKFLDLR
jgi:hypothetical protein